MSDHPDHRLRELLDQAAPAVPDLGPTDRTAAVVRRGRTARRRSRLLVAGAAAAVVGIVAVGPELVGGDGTDEANEPAAPSAAPCPGEPVDVTNPHPVDLGTEVVSVRSCPATWDGATGRPIDPEGLPEGALTGDHAAAFAEDVAALPAYELSSLCASIMMAPQPWALVAARADGEPVVIGSTVTGCGSVQVGGVDRGIEGVLAAFAGNLQRQQAGGLLPGDDVATCPTDDNLTEVETDTWNGSFDVAAATSGAVCYRVDPMGSREYVDLEGSLSPDQLAVLRDDLLARVSAAPRTEMGCIDTGPQRLLVLVDADGDRAGFLDRRCSGEFVGPRGYWQPSDDAERVIADALGGAVPQS